MRVSIALALLLVAVTPGAGRGAQGVNVPPFRPTVETNPAAFRFCRIRFRTSLAGDGNGWYVDYPRADVNLSLRLSQLTRTPIDEAGEGEPVHTVVALTDSELFQCPFVMLTEPGGADFSEREATLLRTYLLKGGFL